MYSLLTESKKNIQTYDISGTIGSVSFTDANIVKGSLSITNQCCDESTFTLGAVYIGQLDCTFLNIDISRNDWVGKAIALSVTINGVNIIPIGTFYVDSAEHTKGLTKIKAYDAMAKFDMAVETNSTINDTPYNILTYICTKCGVPLGMTELEVQSLPNGNDLFFVTEMGDIETYRDILYWISQTLGGFATINRDGELEIRTYHSTVDDTIDYDVRFNTSQYGDEIVKFSGFYWTNDEDGSANYEHATPDDDYYITLGSNPFFQSDARTAYIDGILSALAEIQYNYCDVSIPFGIHYDLGDVLQFPNGQGSASNKFCVVSYTWKYYGEYRMKSIAVPKVSKSKADKNITSIRRRGDEDKIQFYLIENIADIDIGDGETEDIVDLYFAAEKNTVVVFNAELHCQVETTVDDNKYYDAKAEFKYYLNQEEIELFEPKETWLDGDHIKHLMYYITIQSAGTKRLRIEMSMDGGSVHIDMANLKGALYGQNLVASDDWTGVTKISEEAEDIELPTIVLGDYTETVTTTLT